MQIDVDLKKSKLINKKKLKSDFKNVQKREKIAIMGGTFDPIHYGHLATAEVVRIKYNIDKIIFIPCGNPPHKEDRIIIDKMYRYDMVNLAIMTNAYFQASTMEIERTGRTYTVDTLREFKKKYPYAQLYFITGADALCDIDNWKDASEVFKLATFIAATRPGVELNNVEEKILELQEKYEADILNIHVPSLDISSTSLRNSLKRNESVKYLLPEKVEKYIYKNDLYR